ncbi:hypothetical protein HJC23_007649 [Cyclotella cryptica]|uniref:HTH TFE/IIEalpha-type domain-containing protein n=1 Tax=Cyclotella cryptica TaxID=29204 RepID=A0ABD3P803_9STRA
MTTIDQTIHAESLLSTIARAFYPDECVMLIDVLLRDKYLRDDDMAPRLSLPAKQLRRTLQFLEEEMLVKHELVDDLVMGGSQNTKVGFSSSHHVTCHKFFVGLDTQFWYIDYNHAVHVIRLRIHLLQQTLQQAELRARSSSLYLCPGYSNRTCNGKYTENEAQQILDPETGLFLCRECVRAYVNHPNPPDKTEYTLKLVDNQKELKLAMDNMRRVRVQLSGKVDASSLQQLPLRKGIFDLLQKVRPTRGAEPITSNLPSENIAMGIGSSRLKGTGRTAGNLLKKLVKKGIVSADHGGTSAKEDGASGAKRYGPRSGHDNDDELTFLKNAMGQEIAFDLEKGGGARANLLATKGRIREKLVDAAAMKVGVDLGLVATVIMEQKENRIAAKKRKREEKAEGKKKKKKVMELDFLRDNLGFGWDASGSLLSKEEKEKRRLGFLGGENDSSDEDEEEEQLESNYVTDETDELRNMNEHDRRAAFQATYKVEFERQKKLMGLSSSEEGARSPNVAETGDADADSVEWQDG